MATKCFLFLIISLEMKLITNKMSSNVYSNKLSTLPTQSSTATIVPSCYIAPYILNSKRITISPARSKYYHLDHITVSCQSGYYFQKPKPNLNQTVLENICLHSTWQFDLNRLPICEASCQQWSFQDHQWQPIHLLFQEEGTGFLLSPGYPGDIEQISANCSFSIETKRGFLKLSVISLNIPNFFLEITTKDGITIWHNTSHHNQTYHLSGFKKFNILLKPNSYSQRIRGKLENFKLLYRVFETQCKTFMNDGNMIINKTKISNVQTLERYQCRYPYILIGPLQRTCHEGTWLTHTMPTCKFICDANTRLVVDKELRIRTQLKTVLTCKLHIFSSQGNGILKMKIKRSSVTAASCLYVKIAERDPICWTERTNDLIIASPTVLSVFENVFDPSEIIELEFHTLPMRSCPTPPEIKNGFTKMQSSSLYSELNISCASNHFLKGSSTMRCVLDISGTPVWFAEKVSECIKLCHDHWTTITMSTRPMSIPIPPLFNLNLTENQFCKWNIISEDFPPIISITSMKNIKELVNFSVTTWVEGNKQESLVMNTFYKYQNETKMIFVCPKKTCSLRITPRKSLLNFQKKIFIDISLKLADKVPSIENNHGMFFLLLLMALILCVIFLIFVDYSRHPYTGYTIRFINIFKSSKLKRISTFSTHDITSCRPISKTEADIIVFYKHHHSDHAYIHIQRSMSCTEVRKDDPDTFIHRLNKAKRRFSDFTDMVRINYSMKLKKETAEKKVPEQSEAANEAYEWDNENYI